MKEKKPENGQAIDCPYCGHRGKVIRVFDDGHVDVCHKAGKRKVVANSGMEVEVESFIDGCSRDGKIGSDHHAKKLDMIEEDF